MHPKFPRRFFQIDYPKLLRLYDRNGNPPSIFMVLVGGQRVELKEFEITDIGLVIDPRTNRFPIAYTSILSIQVMSQSQKTRGVEPRSPWHAEHKRPNTSISA
ncbi:MAG: hypothetical protein AB1898_19995 [Acidobacteriota bacterium]